jgi:hypothetical protein
VPTSQKLMLQMICKYAEMVNAQIADLLYRVKIAETTFQASPPLLQAYNEAVRHTPRPMLPGLPRQLAALQQEVARLPD